MTVDVFELHKVESCWRPAHMCQIKHLDQLVCRKEFLITMAPAQPRQIIAQSGGQIAKAAIGFNAKRTVCLLYTSRCV